MALLLLDRAQLRVKSEGETLALYEAGERRGTIPIKLIDRCVVHGAQTQFDSGVLMRLAEAGATTVFMSPRQNRRVAFVLGPQHNDAGIRLAQGQRVMDEAWCRQWAARLVHAKTSRQMRGLRQWMRQRPDARKPLFDALQALQPIVRTLGEALAKPPGLDSLRGLEGAAARTYFAGMAGVMPPALQFSGRNRRPPRDPVNAGLSLGYTLLHAQAIGACARAGLDPLLGFYHRPAIGRESLASDLIEPLRPSVDMWLWQLLRDRQLRPEHFVEDKGACLLGKAGREVFYSRWESTLAPIMRRWLRLQTRQLARHMRQQGRDLLLQLSSPDAADDDERH